MIDKITFAGTSSELGQKARCALLKLAGLKISVMSVTNNEPRMNYAQHRQQGLPVTSCLVESLIQEFNHRVKGTEQFWNRPAAAEGEAILQTVASLLSDGEPLSKHILNRPGSINSLTVTPSGRRGDSELRETANVRIKDALLGTSIEQGLDRRVV